MEIKFLLQKYAHLGFAQKRTKEIILQVLQDDFSIELEGNDVVVKDTEVRFGVSGPRKVELFLYKTKIEEKIKEKLLAEKITITRIF